MVDVTKPDAATDQQSSASRGLDPGGCEPGSAVDLIAPFDEDPPIALRRAGNAIALIVIAIGLIAMVGWVLQRPELTTLAPGFVSMKFNAALGAIVCALSLLGHTRGRPGGAFGRAVRRGCSLLAIALGAVTLLQDVVGRDFGIDQLLMPAGDDAVGTPSPGRMAPGTALSLVLIALALLLMDARRHHLRCRAEVAALLTMLLPFLTVVGYAFGVRTLVGITATTQMALSTAVALLLLSLGVVLTVNCKVVRRLLSRDAGGVLTRRLLPLVVCFPVLLGWLRLQGQRHGFYDLEFGLGIMVALSSLLLATVVYWTADTLGRTDNERARMSTALRQANDVLEQRIEERTRGLVSAVELLRIEVEQRVAAEQQARASSERLLAVTETAHDSIIALTGNSSIEYANKAAEAMFGYPLSAMKGIPIQTLFSERYREWCQDILRRYLEADHDGTQGTIAEAVARHRDGREFPVEVSLGRWTIDTQVSFTMIIRDIGGRKELEARVQVSDRMASIGSLAAGVAHEINNPLTYVIGNVHLIDKRIEAALAHLRVAPVPATARDNLDQAREMLNEIKTGGFQIRDIVHNLRTLTRPDTSRREPVNVKEIADAAVNMAWHEIRHRARLEKRYADVPPILGNGSRLGQVVLNLLVNAAHAIPEGHVNDNVVRLAIRMHSTGHVAIEVSDTGSGIAPDIVDRIFDPFFTTKPMGMGTGLGLAIARSIVDELDGRLEVETKAGDGTTFRVLLPVEAPAPAPAPVEEPVVEPRRGRILIVEDEPLVASFLQRTLEAQHEVVTRPSGAEALELLLRDSAFDLILCDLMMPSMTGIELHARLEAELPEVLPRIVFITGGAFTATARAFTEQTTNLVLEKTMDPTTLRACVNALIGPRER
jgi:PAS domain S-box-containing protein